MTSPYLERPCRPLEEAKRQLVEQQCEQMANFAFDGLPKRVAARRNWGIPQAPEPPMSRKDYRLGILVTVAVSCAGWFAIFALSWAIIHLYATI